MNYTSMLKSIRFMHKMYARIYIIHTYTVSIYVYDMDDNKPVMNGKALKC